jgi:hypothetical protein
MQIVNFLWRGRLGAEVELDFGDFGLTGLYISFDGVESEF